MRTIVKGKNYDVPERVRQYAERKLRRLDRILDDRSDAIVELSVEGHHTADSTHVVDVTLVVDGQTLRGRAAAANHTAGVDEVVDKIERRVVDFRKKPRERRLADAQSTGRASAGIGDVARSAGEAGGDEDEGRRRVVKVKRFAIEPMFEEDAVTEMEELGHSFFVFVNAETERIAILYRRQAGDFGLIEPVVGGDYTLSAGGSRRSGMARR